MNCHLCVLELLSNCTKTIISSWQLNTDHSVSVLCFFLVLERCCLSFYDAWKHAHNHQHTVQRLLWLTAQSWPACSPPVTVTGCLEANCLHHCHMPQLWLCLCLLFLYLSSSSWYPPSLSLSFCPLSLCLTHTHARTAWWQSKQLSSICILSFSVWHIHAQSNGAAQ